MNEKKSALEKVNRYFFQWLFMRLGKGIDTEKNRYYYCILFGIVPGTGWDTDYRFIKPRFNFRVTPYMRMKPKTLSDAIKEARQDNLFEGRDPVEELHKLRGREE